MTTKEAYRILGLSSEADFPEIKKRYRHLMMQVHPDVNVSSNQNYTYDAQKINHAYSVLKQELPIGSKNVFHSRKKRSTKEKKNATWNAPVNVDAYREREVLQYAEDFDGTVLGSFCIDRGKFLWTIEEDFSLFLLSIYQCSKELLEEIDASLHRKETLSIQHQFQTKLAYLLAQQFIAGTAMLKEFAKKEKPDQDGHQIFYISSMLELTEKTVTLKTGELLYPSKVRQHKLYLKKQSGQELGYLSFSDDRLYYIVVPLLEQKRVQIRIQVAERQPVKGKRTTAKYQNLHLWIKLRDRNIAQIPENLNLQIEQLLLQYRQC